MRELYRLSSLWAGQSVGLLGGSFNPAHEGHLHISKEAMKRLHLDAIWWMVSPQNPLKSTKNMALFEDRFNDAKAMTRHHPRIFPVDIELYLNSCYTAETLGVLRQRCPQINFVWLMGGDNLKQIHKWEYWQRIFALMPVAVIDRPPATQSVRNCPAMMRFAKNLLCEKDARLLKHQQAPCWSILHVPLHPLSATLIRDSKAENQDFIEKRLAV